MAPVRFVYMVNPAAVPTMPNMTNIAKTLDVGCGGLSLGWVSPFISDNFLNNSLRLPDIVIKETIIMVFTTTITTRRRRSCRSWLIIWDENREKEDLSFFLHPDMSTRLKVDTIRDWLIRFLRSFHDWGWADLLSLRTIQKSFGLPFFVPSKKSRAMTRNSHKIASSTTKSKQQHRTPFRSPQVANKSDYQKLWRLVNSGSLNNNVVS